ncbi:MAG: HlyD family efflux transporter periplasmic adaptor subunit [Candidatus Manganitrophaceae bacterium]|nr:MAG: HlyD family efflux transporter periplasmic adaptor subunit [Candidatus Manganitrophaceae bacterium]
MRSKIAIPIIVVILVGIVVVFLTLRTDNASMGKDPQAKEGSEKKEAEVVKGPHGGRLLSKDGFQVEVTIYEKGVPPQFRIYSYEKGKPIDPNEVRLDIALHRLGGRIDEIRFQKEGEYLHGDKVVEEPHSFDVRVAAEWKGQSYQWEYSQVEGRVEMAPEAAKAAGIEIQTAGPVRMKTILELPGEIGFNKNKVAHVVPRLSGVVTEVRKNLGDQVKRGEVIAVIDSRELAEAKTEYIESVHRLEFSQAAFVREEALWKKKISPEQDYLAARHRLEEAEIARQAAEQKLLALGLSRAELSLLATEPEGEVIQHQIRAPFSERALTRYELRSPQDGIVIEKRVSVGEAIKEDADIFVIADLSTVWGEITVYAKDLRVVGVGQKVTVRSKELGLEATGKVSYLGPLIGGQTRAAAAHVDIPNPKGLWRPGLFVTVELFQEEVPVPVAVSADALQTFRDWDVVFVQYGNQFEARPLELGRSDGKWVEVVSGLAPGEKYATRNSFVLKADLGKSGATHDH